MSILEQWYRGINKKQKIFAFVVSILALPIFIGFIPLIIFIYFELGDKNGK